LARIEEAKRALEERARQRHENAMKRHEERLRQREEEKSQTGHSPGGNPPEPPAASGPDKKDQHNFTDADSRIMKSHGAFEQCFNAQAAVDVEDMLIVGTSLSNNAADATSLGDTLESIEENNNDLPGAVVADAGYMSDNNVADCVERGIDPYFAVGRDKHNATLGQRLGKRQRAPKGLSETRKHMWHKVRDEFGKDILQRQYPGEADGFKVVSFAGGTCCVYTDEQKTRAYKVYMPDNEGQRDPASMKFGSDSQEYADHEIRVVQTLGIEGACPADDGSLSRRSFLDGNNEIPAVVSMEYIDIGKVPIEDDELIEKEVVRLVDVLHKHKAMPRGASDLTWDAGRQRLIIMDPAEIKFEADVQRSDIEHWVRDQLLYI